MVFNRWGSKLKTVTSLLQTPRMIYQLVFALLLLPSVGLAQSLPASLTAETTTDGVLVREGSDSVLFYQRATKSQRGAYPRANYIHPLYGLDGTVLTEDFPEDHPHHRGIFWAWHQIVIGDSPVGDAWACEDFRWDVQQVTPQPQDNGSLVLHTNTLWESPRWTDADGSQIPFLTEAVEMTVHPKENNYRVIDIEISLLALVPNLKIGGSEDEKGYSGFSVRMRLPEDVQFASMNGAVTPTTNALMAGPWMNISGALAADGGQAGIVIIDHSSNQDTPWILRSERSMQNVAYPGRHLVAISEQEPTVLRYSLVLYQDKLPPQTIDSLYSTSAKEPTIQSLLVEQLKKSHSAPDWYVPLNSALNGLTAEQAHWSDSTDNHSICQLVSHIIFWNERVLIAFQGDTPPDFDDNNEETFMRHCQGNWAASVQKIDSLQTAWEQAVKYAAKDQLNAWSSTVADISAHNAYHTGQIVYIRKRNGWWDTAKGVK